MSELISSFLGIFSAQGQKESVKANNRVKAANVEASNKVRTARNAANAAKLNLDRWLQATNNNKVLEAGGEALEANIVNYRRHADAALTQSFSEQIRDAEQAGAAQAAQAYSGVDGEVVDMVNGATALRNSITRQRASDIADFQNYDTARRSGAIMTQMVDGLDNSLILNTFDHNVDALQQDAVPGTGPAVLRFGIAALKAYMTMGASEMAPADTSMKDGMKAPPAAFQFKTTDGGYSISDAPVKFGEAPTNYFSTR